MEITWDEPKRQANILKHGLDFADLDEAFFASAVIVPGKARRLIAINRWPDEAILVIFARLGREGISVVSMRRANKKERSVLDAES